jgi:hypothetical protein
VSTRTPSPKGSRYGEPTFRRTALAPGIIAAILLLVGFALIGSDAFLWILYPISILALIVAWFAFQARHWWWIPPLLAIAVLWNPVFPFGFDGPLWLGAQYLAILVFVLAGVLIKVPVAADEKPRR